MNADNEKLQRLIIESRNKFRTLVDGIDDEIFSIDKDFRITSVNQSLARALNQHPKTVVGQTCYEAIYKYKNPCAQAGEPCPAQAAKRSARIETILKTVEEDKKPPRYLEIRAMPLFDDQKEIKGVILVRRDVTIQKEAEKQIKEYNKRLQEEVKRQTAELEQTNRQLIIQRNELEKANKELKELEQIKSDLTNMVIHDLKGPLAEIVANLEMIKYEALSDFQQEVLQSAILGSDEMSRMIANLLVISRMEEKKMQFDISTFEPRKLIEDIVARYRPLAKMKNITISTNIPAELPLIESDSLLLERILINLITNAIEHTRETGHIMVRAETGQGEFHCEIQDDGRGIPEELLDKIFDKFSQGREGVPKTGSGLGLTFCKMAVEALGGRISVKSKAGEGTTFYFSLPLEKFSFE